MKNIILSTVLIFVSTSGFAGSLNCSSADSKIQYQTSQNDGGAAMRRAVLLRVNGEEVINISSFGNAELVNGKIEFSSKKLQLKVTKTKDYKTSYYNVNAKVSDLNDKVIASDMVHCKEVVYTGVPRP